MCLYMYICMHIDCLMVMVCPSCIFPKSVSDRMVSQVPRRPISLNPPYQMSYFASLNEIRNCFLMTVSTSFLLRGSSCCRKRVRTSSLSDCIKLLCKAPQEKPSLRDTAVNGGVKKFLRRVKYTSLQILPCTTKH